MNEQENALKYLAHEKKRQRLLDETTVALYFYTQTLYNQNRKLQKYMLWLNLFIILILVLFSLGLYAILIRLSS